MPRAAKNPWRHGVEIGRRRRVGLRLASHVEGHAHPAAIHRHHASKRRMRDARQRRDSGVDVLEEPPATCLVVALKRDVHRGHEHALGLEAGCDRAKRANGSKQQPGADEQQHAQRDLPDDKGVSQRQAPGTAERRRVLLECRHQVGPRRAPRRCQAKGERGDKRAGKSEEQHARLADGTSSGRRQGEVARQNRQEPLRAPERHQEAGESRDTGQEQAFCQELAYRGASESRPWPRVPPSRAAVVRRGPAATLRHPHTR